VGEVGVLSKNIKEEFPIWRVWLNTNEPLNEIRFNWTFIDVMKANALLDMQDDMKGAVDAYLEKEKK